MLRNSDYFVKSLCRFLFHNNKQSSRVPRSRLCRINFGNFFSISLILSLMKLNPHHHHHKGSYGQQWASKEGRSRTGNLQVVARKHWSFNHLYARPYNWVSVSEAYGIKTNLTRDSSQRTDWKWSGLWHPQRGAEAVFDMQDQRMDNEPVR